MKSTAGFMLTGITRVPTCLTTGDELGADLEQLDHRAGPDERMILGELAEYRREHPIGSRVDRAEDRGAHGDARGAERRVASQVVHRPADPQR